jgi:hypothetical protein
MGSYAFSDVGAYIVAGIEIRMLPYDHPSRPCTDFSTAVDDPRRDYRPWAPGNTPILTAFSTRLWKTR